MAIDIIRDGSLLDGYQLITTPGGYRLIACPDCKHGITKTPGGKSDCECTCHRPSFINTAKEYLDGTGHPNTASPLPGGEQEQGAVP